MNRHRRFNQSGSHIIAIGIGLLFLVIASFAAYRLVSLPGQQKDSGQKSSTSTKSTTESTPAKTASNITWMQTAEGYKPSSTPPECPAKIVEQFPADIKQVTAVLYPGQTRGGNYKPHGGLRFDNAPTNKVSVKAPFDGKIIAGSAYIADGAVNDVQYTFDVMNDCGIMYRVGHLLTLSPKLAEVAKAFPAPQKNDSRTTRVDNVPIDAGAELATAIGTATDKNVFFDWGVYDWRKPNAISSDAAWAANSAHNNELARHAVCWFDHLSDKDTKTLKALPAGDPTSGKTSDYCK
jgi:hypothetical protein